MMMLDMYSYKCTWVAILGSTRVENSTVRYPIFLMVAGLWIFVVEHSPFDQLLDHSVAPMHPQSFQEFGLIQVLVLACVEASTSIPALHAPLPG